MPDIARRVLEVQQRIAAAAARSGRTASDVTLVAAGKTRRPAEVDAVLAAGVTEIGENYAQEASDKKPDVTLPARWRMIGHLQQNKANLALDVFDTLDSLDSAKLAGRLSRRLDELGCELEVLVQVRLGGEESKSGVEPTALHGLLTTLQQTPPLRCLGLMTMPPPGDPELMRRYHAELRALAEREREQTGLQLEVLSMGMSHDYEVAIEEGATHVRIGTALFGPRG